LPGPQQKRLRILFLGNVAGADRLNSLLHGVRQRREVCPSSTELQKNCVDGNIAYLLPLHYTPPSISRYVTREPGENTAKKLITN